MVRFDNNGLAVGTIPMKELLLRIDELCPDTTVTFELLKADVSMNWLKEEGIWNF